MQLLGAATAAPRRSVARGGRAQLIECIVRRTLTTLRKPRSRETAVLGLRQTYRDEIHRTR